MIACQPEQSTKTKRDRRHVKTAQFARTELRELRAKQQVLGRAINAKLAKEGLRVLLCVSGANTTNTMKQPQQSHRPVQTAIAQWGRATNMEDLQQPLRARLAPTVITQTARQLAYALRALLEKLQRALETRNARRAQKVPTQIQQMQQLLVLRAQHQRRRSTAALQRNQSASVQSTHTLTSEQAHALHAQRGITERT